MPSKFVPSFVISLQYTTLPNTKKDTLLQNFQWILILRGRIRDICFSLLLEQFGFGLFLEVMVHCLFSLNFDEIWQLRRVIYWKYISIFISVDQVT